MPAAIFGFACSTTTRKSVIEMARPASMSCLGSEFDNFLFAPIVEDKNGVLLSVVSVLGRLDLDPDRKLPAWPDCPQRRPFRNSLRCSVYAYSDLPSLPKQDLAYGALTRRGTVAAARKS
jgi:hypothetical protein